MHLAHQLAAGGSSQLGASPPARSSASGSGSCRKVKLLRGAPRMAWGSRGRKSPSRLSSEPWIKIKVLGASLRGSVVKNLLADAGDTGSIPDQERFFMPRSN